MSPAPGRGRRRVLFLYNVPGWAIHNVGLDWASLLGDSHEFAFARFGEHECEHPQRYEHVVFGYSTLRWSGRMLAASLARRPLAWLRWARARGGSLAAVVQDPSEVFPETEDWRRHGARVAHLRRFSRLAVTSNEMRIALTAAGVAVHQVSTRSRLPLRDPATLTEEPLRVCTRALDYPRKNLAQFRDLQARIGLAERFDGLIGGPLREADEYAATLDQYNCYLCTSWQEGGPLPVMDALRRGCVVLTTRVGQTDEWVEHGVNGFFSDDTAAFETSLRRLASDPALLLRMRRAALARAALDDSARVRAQLLEFLP